MESLNHRWCKSVMDMVPSTWSHKLLQDVTILQCSSYKIAIRRTLTLSRVRSQEEAIGIVLTWPYQEPPCPPKSTASGLNRRFVFWSNARTTQAGSIYPNQMINGRHTMPWLFIVALMLLYQYVATEFTSSSASLAFELEASKYSRNWFAVLGELIWCNSVTRLSEVVIIEE